MGTYSYARSVFVQMLPRGKEAEMFALFEITDKGSSWIGPLTTAVIANTLSIRWAMIYVVFFFLIPMVILVYGVNLEKGMREAGRFDVAVSTKSPMVGDEDKENLEMAMAEDKEPLTKDETEKVITSNSSY